MLPDPMPSKLQEEPHLFPPTAALTLLSLLQYPSSGDFPFLLPSVSLLHFLQFCPVVTFVSLI